MLEETEKYLIDRLAMFEEMVNKPLWPGLYPTFIDPNTGNHEREKAAGKRECGNCKWFKKANGQNEGQAGTTIWPDFGTCRNKAVIERMENIDKNLIRQTWGSLNVYSVDTISTGFCPGYLRETT